MRDQRKNPYNRKKISYIYDFKMNDLLESEDNFASVSN